MDDKDILLWGAIDGNLWEQDYAGDIPQDVPRPKENFLTHKSEYSQTRSTCVLYGAGWCIADNTSYDITIEDWKNVEALAPQYWRSVEHWMYLTKWGDLWVDYLKTKSIELVKGVVWTYTQDFFDIMDMWYSILFGSQISKSYITDLEADWDIDIGFNPWTWHARRMFKHTNGNYYIVENFVWRLKYNVIEVTPVMLDTLIKNKDLFNQSFYFYIKETMTNYPPHNQWTTIPEKEIVKAWEQIIDAGWKPLYANYTDEFYITRMINEIGIYRNQIKK